MSAYKPKACAVCKTVFQPNGPNFKSCSDACSKELLRRREAKRNAKAERKEYSKKYMRYYYHSSAERKAKHKARSKAAAKKREAEERKNRVFVCAPIVCSQCGGVFWVSMYPGQTPPKACSAECRRVAAAASTRAITAQRKAKGVCVRCAGEKDRKGTLCSSCLNVVNENTAAWLGQNRPRRLDPSIPRQPIKWRMVAERDGWKCQICGCSTPASRRGTRHHNAPEIDHRVPLTKGGSHTYDNVQLACRKCNARKSNASNIGQLPMFGVGVRRPGSWMTGAPTEWDPLESTCRHASLSIL